MSQSTEKYQEYGIENSKFSLFSFSGCISRKIYWAVFIVNIAVLLILGIASALLIPSLGKELSSEELRLPILIIGFLFFILLGWIGLATSIKRFRDANFSPWLVLLNFIPYLGSLIVVVLNGLFPSVKQGNRYCKSKNNFSTKTTPSNSNSSLTTVQPVDEEQCITTTDSTSDNELYEQALLEIEEGNAIKSIWAKALASSNGNKDKAISIYIKDRVLSLQKLNKETASESDKRYVKMQKEVREEKRKKEEAGYLELIKQGNKLARNERERQLLKFLDKNQLKITKVILDTKIKAKSNDSVFDIYAEYTDGHWVKVNKVLSEAEKSENSQYDSTNYSSSTTVSNNNRKTTSLNPMISFILFSVTVIFLFKLLVG